ncbi:MAG: hypothetical protein KKH32_05360 [Bacteroidetes bacterium]|nr:hypothetical protein [Bacteroidota bacterium]
MKRFLLFLSLITITVIILATFSLLTFKETSETEVTKEDMLAHKIKSKRERKAAYDKPMEAMKFYYDQRAFPIGYIPENWRSDALTH